MKIFELVFDSNSCISIVLPIEIGACAAVANYPKPPSFKTADDQLWEVSRISLKLFS